MYSSYHQQIPCQRTCLPSRALRFGNSWGSPVDWGEITLCGDVLSPRVRPKYQLMLEILRFPRESARKDRSGATNELIQTLVL